MNGTTVNGIELQNWIDAKLSEIAFTLPILAKRPSSFGCGHEMGYKQALLDLEKFLYKEFDND